MRNLKEKNTYIKGQLFKKKGFQKVKIKKRDPFSYFGTDVALTDNGDDQSGQNEEIIFIADTSHQDLDELLSLLFVTLIVLLAYIIVILSFVIYHFS